MAARKTAGFSRVSHRSIALVTGGNSGIGFETCKGLLEAGFHVVVCARSKDKADRAIASLLQDGPKGSTAESLVLDLASLDSVREAANTFLATERPLHVCVLNAGIMALPWHKTADGFEQQWQVNVLGHFLFGRLLLPAITAAKGPTGRIVHVASGAHRLHSEEVDYELLATEHESEEGFDQWKAYGRSKLANILLSNELARRLKAAGAAVTSNTLHPGNVNTALWSKAGRNNDSGIPVEEGALTSIYLATSQDVEGHSGGYYFLCKPASTIYDDEKHRNLDYISKSAMRAEVSVSEMQGKAAWTVASKNVSLGEEL
jgi:NAD(P)-dependent dehydrogenase (short-subunit alcohol dehydrogenase family)